MQLYQKYRRCCVYAVHQAQENMTLSEGTSIEIKDSDYCICREHTRHRVFWISGLVSVWIARVLPQQRSMQKDFDCVVEAARVR